MSGEGDSDSRGEGGSGQSVDGRGTAGSGNTVDGGGSGKGDLDGGVGPGRGGGVGSGKGRGTGSGGGVGSGSGAGIGTGDSAGLGTGSGGGTGGGVGDGIGGDGEGAQARFIGEVGTGGTGDGVRGDGSSEVLRFDTPPIPRRVDISISRKEIPGKLRHVRDSLVRFELLISEVGEVIEAKIVESTGYDEIDALLLAKIYTSWYHPATLRDEAVKAWIVVGYGYRVGK